MDCSMPVSPVLHCLPKSAQIHVHWVGDSIYRILCRPLLLPPSIFTSIRVFSESVLCIRWPKYWSFSFSISPSNEHSGLISFRMDWLDLLAVQGTQHHNFKASIFQCYGETFKIIKWLLEKPTAFFPVNHPVFNYKTYDFISLVDSLHCLLSPCPLMRGSCWMRPLAELWSAASNQQPGRNWGPKCKGTRGTESRPQTH